MKKHEKTKSLEIVNCSEDHNYSKRLNEQFKTENIPKFLDHQYAQHTVKNDIIISLKYADDIGHGQAATQNRLN